MQRAYQLSGSGDNVQMAGGNYGTQTLSRVSSKDSYTQQVVFEEQVGAEVHVSGLRFGANYDAIGAWHVRVKNITIDNWLDLRRTRDTTFEGVQLDGVHTAGALDTEFFGGEWGPQENPDGGHPEFTRYRDTQDTNGTLIDGVHIHHIGRPLGREDVHTNCLHFWGGNPTGITIRNNTFDHCDVFDSLLNSGRNILIEGNDFGPSTNTGFTGTAYYSLMIGRVPGPVTIRNNIFRMRPTLNGTNPSVVSACGNSGQLGPYSSWANPC
jgi:hypothetical protein